ncbi:outer membrane protein assembly factor BamB family protein [Streptomyces atratus]|uniref:PQQ-like domain-containing protein n=1 Tax=Streptomyces atratus TaxID=1893 RepID=A0A1K2E1R5_STRAR|nr:PQQ-binding-like beta-propeller repeat protein [Streptomyces atratus]SFY29022.1 PQQ-like domain-containing protein [Streptomyces atratus]
MTQPPGQQPPQGGFGAPYDPPPGSYGPPTQPPGQAAGPYGTQPPGPYGPAPAQPGPYNAPAQPGPYNAPAQPGPYNAPAQPGPYNVPTQPGPYGVPSPPQSGGPADGSGGGGLFRGRRGAVIGAVLAVVLLAGGGVWLATSGDEDKPTAKKSAAPEPSTSSTGKPKGKEKDPGPSDLRAEADGINTLRDPGEAKVLWLQEGGVDLPRDGASVYGPWFVGDTVVKAMFHTVSGYSAADGSEKWSLRLPGKLCGAPSQATTDGKIVFGVESGSGNQAECNGLQMADLTTGKAGWYKTYKRQGAWDLLSYPAMAINGDTVTVGRKTRTDAFRVSDGKVLFGELPGNCQPFGFASGPLGIAAASCQTAADDHKEQLVERIDPASGKVLWKYKVKKGWEVSQFYSVSPLVVSLKKERDWAIVTLDANGTYRSQLVGGNENYRVECDTDLITGGGNLDNCLGVAADDRTVYLATEAAKSGSGPTNKVVAFDLASGRTRWKAAAPAGQTMMPMRVEGGRLLLFVESSLNKAGAIASLPPAGGTPQLLLRHPDGGVRTERSVFQPRVAYVNGRSLLMSTSISGVEDGDEKRAKSMEMFGN